MNVKGGGITYISDIQSPELKMFQAGLKNHALHADGSTVKGLRARSIRDMHDKINYERGFISHSRSTANQHINFHFMFGGFKEYVVNRYLLGLWYRKNVRTWWFPIGLSYTLGGATMRMYDNAAHDYFYFTD